MKYYEWDMVPDNPWRAIMADRPYLDPLEEYWYQEWWIGSGAQAAEAEHLFFTPHCYPASVLDGIKLSALQWRRYI